MPDITVEQAKAHLTLLGYYPVRYGFPWSKSKFVGIRNATQVISIKFGNVHFEPPHILADIRCTEIEWWVLTDDTILRLAKTIDNELIGW